MAHTRDECNHRALLRCSACEFLPGVDVGQVLAEVHLIDGRVQLWRTYFQNQAHAVGAVTKSSTFVEPAGLYLLECRRGHGFEVPGRWVIRQVYASRSETSGPRWERERTAPADGDSKRVPVKFRRRVAV